jgi:DNA-binding NarL/FixJ family response regulator
VIRVLLADDHTAIRSGLRLLLEDDGILVVGEAGDGAEAIARARELRPDVVLMDVRMPGVDGIRATREIVDEGLADVLVLTSFDLDDVVLGAIRAGAVGFLLKSTGATELRDAVRRVAAGDGVLAPEVTRRALAEVATPAPVAPRHPLLDTLTEREREVLAHLGRGRSNAEIAAALTVSATTAKSHVSHVLTKLGVATRMQAAVVAREGGLS